MRDPRRAGASMLKSAAAYAGHASFFTFISEMRNPKDYPKALYTLQFIDTALYIIVGVVV